MSPTAFYIREDISSTLISAATRNFPAGTRRCPTCHCAKFRQRFVNADVVRSLDKNSQRSLELIGRQLPAFI